MLFKLKKRRIFGNSPQRDEQLNFPLGLPEEEEPRSATFKISENKFAVPKNNFRVKYG